MHNHPPSKPHAASRSVPAQAPRPSQAPAQPIAAGLTREELREIVIAMIG